jgi:hypothetical protein
MEVETKTKIVAILLSLAYIAFLGYLVLSSPGFLRDGIDSLFGAEGVSQDFGKAILRFLLLLTIPLLLVGLKASYDLTQLKRWARYYLIAFNICFLIITLPLVAVIVIFAGMGGRMDAQELFAYIAVPTSYALVFLATLVLIVSRRIKESLF